MISHHSSVRQQYNTQYHGAAASGIGRRTRRSNKQNQDDARTHRTATGILAARAVVPPSANKRWVVTDKDILILIAARRSNFGGSITERNRRIPQLGSFYCHFLRI